MALTPGIDADAFHDAARLLRDELERSINSEIAAAARDQSGGANNAYHSSVLAKSEGVQNIRKDEKERREEARRAELMAQLMMIEQRIQEIDVELDGLYEQREGIMETLFSPEELEAIEALPPEQRDAEMRRILDEKLANGEITQAEYDEFWRLQDRIDALESERDGLEREAMGLQAGIEASGEPAPEFLHERNSAVSDAMDVEVERRDAASDQANGMDDNVALTAEQRVDLDGLQDMIDMMYEHIDDPVTLRSELQNLVSGITDPEVLDALSEQEQRTEAANIIYVALTGEESTPAQTAEVVQDTDRELQTETNQLGAPTLG